MKYKIDEYVYTVIDNSIYEMIIESVVFNLNTNNTLIGTFTLIHRKSDYNNKTIKKENEIYKTIEELKQAEYLKIDKMIELYKKYKG